MYCLYGNSNWYIDCCPLYGRCPLLGVSVIGGSTVYKNKKKVSQKKREVGTRLQKTTQTRGIGILHYEVYQ